MADDKLRVELAYMFWGFNEGYILPSDRAVGKNWMYDADEVLHPDDIRDRAAYLATADQFLASPELAEYVATKQAEALRELLADLETRQFPAPSHVDLRSDNGYLSMTTVRLVVRDRAERIANPEPGA